MNMMTGENISVAHMMPMTVRQRSRLGGTSSFFDLKLDNPLDKSTSFMPKVPDSSKLPPDTFTVVIYEDNPTGKLVQVTKIYQLKDDPVKRYWEPVEPSGTRLNELIKKEIIGDQRDQLQVLPNLVTISEGDNLTSRPPAKGTHFRSVKQDNSAGNDIFRVLITTPEDLSK